MTVWKNLVSLILILMSFCNGYSQDSWVLKKAEKGIKIYTRPKANIPFDEYKATTIIDTSIENVLNELLEAPEYYDECPSEISYYLKSISKNQHLFYVHKSFPWPIKDRDIITLLTIEKLSDKKIKLYLESAPNQIPKKNKTIRIKDLMGFWLLEEKNNKTMVTQQLYLDPEGSLPPFIVNKLLVKGPYRTFSVLQDLKDKSS